MLFQKFLHRVFRPRWQIGFLVTPLTEAIKGTALTVEWVKNPYRDGWLADPFVLNVSDEVIDLLVEDFRYDDGKGRISKVTVDRQTMEITARTVLLEGGHYSFPAILRRDGKIFVYPEQSRRGRLELFEYEPDREECRLVGTVAEEPLTDAVMYDGMMFSTRLPEPNGKRLYSFKVMMPSVGTGEKGDGNRPEYSGGIAGIREYVFGECIARNAGDFFECEGKVYRPAQECNRWYGNALSIQQMENETFTEVRRIRGLHTLNACQGVTVVDRKVFPFKWLYWLSGQSDL